MRAEDVLLSVSVPVRVEARENGHTAVYGSFEARLADGQVARFDNATSPILTYSPDADASLISIAELSIDELVELTSAWPPDRKALEARRIAAASEQMQRGAPTRQILRTLGWDE